MIMRTVPSGNAVPQGTARQFWAKRVVRPLEALAGGLQELESRAGGYCAAALDD